MGFHVLDLYSQFTQMELSSQARARLQEAKVGVDVVHNVLWQRDNDNDNNDTFTIVCGSRIILMINAKRWRDVWRTSPI